MTAPHWARPDHHPLPRGTRTDSAGHDGTSLDRRPRQSTAPAGLFAPAPEVIAEKAVKAKRKTYRPTGTKRPIAACGTVSGYSRHKRLKEDVCVPCRDANRKHKREYRKRGAQPIEPIECGTVRGYRRHERRKEATCGPCKVVYSAYQREKYAKRAERLGMEREAS